MCIQFTYVNNEATGGQYSVIIANNRDELYSRPTKPASVWDRAFQCISGLDLHHDKDGHTHGTWIAVSGKKRKIGSLINIMTNTRPDPHLKGRGNLVTEFISGSKTASDFLHNIEHHDQEYNPFNLIFLEESDGKWHAYYHYSGDRYTTKIKSSVFGVASSPMANNFQKVTCGEARFKDIVTQNDSTDREESLISDILSLMADKTSNLPDPVLHENLPPYFAKAESAHSAICVEQQELQYGTRTHTVILIEASGKGRYIEKTLECREDGAHFWNTTTLQF